MSRFERPGIFAHPGRDQQIVLFVNSTQTGRQHFDHSLRELIEKGDRLDLPVPPYNGPEINLEIPLADQIAKWASGHQKTWTMALAFGRFGAKVD